MTGASAVRSPLGIGLAALLVAIAAFSALSVPLAVPLLDPFHEGEYLSPRLYFADRANGLPLLIHGILNYLPAQWAATLCGTDYVIICTRITNMWLAAGSSAAWALLAAGLMRSRRMAWLAGLTAGALLLLFNGTRVEPVSLHQGAPSVRDLVLLCELGVLLGIFRGGWTRVQPMLFALAGIAAAIGLPWAYTRGLVGMATLAVGVVLALYRGRSVRAVLAAPVALLVGLGTLYLADPAMFPRHVANIRYWMQHREIWSQPFPPRSAIYVAAYLGLVAVAMVRALQLHLAARRDEAAGLVLLAVPVVAILYQSLGRADVNHMLWVMPFAYLLAAAFVATLTWPLRLSKRWHWAALAAIGCAILLILAFQGLRRPNSLIGHGSNSNLALAIRPLPDDGTLAGDTARIVGTLIRSTGQRCTYVMNNGGAYYEAAGLPPCSALMYPIYASGPMAEQQVIADLRRTRPILLVGHDHSWSDKIDGRSMADRTPVLSAWIDREYPVAGHVGTVELRRRRESVKVEGQGTYDRM